MPYKCQNCIKIKKHSSKPCENLLEVIDVLSRLSCSKTTKKNAEDKGKYRTVFQRDSFSIQKIKIFGGEIEL